MITCHPYGYALNDFFFETPQPVFFEFHLEPFVNEGLKICSNGYSPFIKMALMSIYGKTLLLQN